MAKLLGRLGSSLGCVARLGQQSRRRLSRAMSRLQSGERDEEERRALPTRQQQLDSLETETFDVLVVGGGAVGCGCALEAASRGLKTALIERNDFGSGASSKSSKLIEGSNSYLHAALQGANFNKISTLGQVLSERAIMLSIAPHLNRVQPMLMPIYSPMRLPLYWLGLKVYDVMAGRANVRGSHFLSKSATLNEFPLLRRDGLLGSLVYYDVQLDDARMCLALALTAAKQGATVANYVRLQDLEPLRDGEDQCRTVLAQDGLERSNIAIRSRAVINATGAGTDAVRQLDDSRLESVAQPRLGGVHIALPSHYGSQTCGLLFPSNELAGDPLIMLPFENRLLVGSLDVDSQPAPTAEMIECLLDQTRPLLDECVELAPNQVLSAWAGLQAKPVSNYLLEVSDNQLITLAGGRWSMYRKMAIAAINMAIDRCQLEPQLGESISDSLLLDGAANYCCMLALDLLQAYDLPMDVAQHLAESYGTNANRVVEGAPSCGRERLLPNLPYIRAEVLYACRHEYAVHLVDVIARRLRVAFVDAAAAADMLPDVLEIMAGELDWPLEQQALELGKARHFLNEQMGLESIQEFRKMKSRPVRCCSKPKQERLRRNVAKWEPPKESLLGRLKDYTSSWLQKIRAPTEAEGDCETDSDVDPRSRRPAAGRKPPSAPVDWLPEILPAEEAAAEKESSPSAKSCKEACSTCFQAARPSQEVLSRGCPPQAGEATRILSSQRAGGDPERSLKNAVKALLEVKQLLMQCRATEEPRIGHPPRKRKKKILLLGRKGNSSVPKDNPCDPDTPA